MTENFEGFVPPQKNWFPMPNEWTDITSDIESLAELKIVEYVLRHTWGYHEFGMTKTISVDEFMHGRRRNDGSRLDKGTGLKSDRSVKDGIKLAVKHGYLFCEVDPTDQARIKKSYGLKMMTPVSDGCNLPPVETTPGIDDEIRGVQSTPQEGSIYPSEVQNLPLGGAKSTPRSEKETIERNYRKKPKKETSGVDANAQHTHTFIYRHDFNGRSFYYHDQCNQQQDRGCNEGMTFTVMRLENVPQDAQCDICYQPIHASPSNHLEQADDISYSQQGTTGNALLENGEDHVLLPDHDHDVTGLDSLHADPDTRRATQAGHLPLKKNNNENHSHEEIDHGLFDGTPTGGVGAGHTPDAQASSRCGPSQSGEPDPGRLPVADGAASGDIIQGVRGKARAQASTATAARGRGAGHATDAVSDKVAPHQGSVQTDATPSLSVENPVVVGGKSNPIGEESKPTRGRRKPKVLAPEQMTRVNKVYDAFDALAQEVSDDPDFHYSRTKKTTQAISEWLTSQPTEKLLRETYKKLANTPADPKSGFSWAENLSIEAVLRQCDKRRLSDSIKNKRLTDNHVVTATKTAAPKLWVEEEEEDTRPVILLSRLQEARRNGYATPTFH